MANPVPSTAAIATDKPPRRRRWIPVSLKIFAANIALVAIGAAWVAIMAYRQHVALAVIEQAGGSVEIRSRAPQWLSDHLGDELANSLDDVVEVNLASKPATDATLRHISRLKGLERLHLNVTEVTDAGLANFDGLNTLRVLSLSNTNVTDAGLVHLRRLTNLEALELDGTLITDAGLSHLKGLSRLTSLSLERTHVTDAGLSELKRFASLQVLSLDSTQFTDAGRVALDAQPGLLTVWVDNQKVAETEIANDVAGTTQPAVADLVERLDSVERRHFWSSHDDSNVFESTVQRIIQLGGLEAEELLSLKLKGEASELRAAQRRTEKLNWKDDFWYSEEREIDRLSNNLELLTALRRLQKRSDPLSISVALPRDRHADTRTLPTFSVSLKSVDVERIPVWVQLVPHFHGTHREAQWRFEVRDQAGKLLPIRPNNDAFRFGGGTKSDGWLPFGQVLNTTLPMGDFIDISKPGEYTVTILYHAKLAIADETSPNALDDLITFRSVPFQLTVNKGAKRVIKSSRTENQRALSLIKTLPNEGVVKIVGETYDADDYSFVPPETPAGQLLTVGWQAVPALIESLSDDAISRHQKAWVLGLLYTTTAERNFDPVEGGPFGDGSGALPDYACRSGQHSGWSRSGGRIIPKEQDRIITRWKDFASEYLDFQTVGE